MIVVVMVLLRQTSQFIVRHFISGIMFTSLRLRPRLHLGVASEYVKLDTCVVFASFVVLAEIVVANALNMMSVVCLLRARHP